jgi:hypothetical protein
MISTRSLELVIDTIVCLTLAKWETVSGQFGGYLTGLRRKLEFPKFSSWNYPKTARRPPVEVKDVTTIHRTLRETAEEVEKGKLQLPNIFS